MQAVRRQQTLTCTLELADESMLTDRALWVALLVGAGKSLLEEGSEEL